MVDSSGRSLRVHARTLEADRHKGCQTESDDRHDGKAKPAERSAA